MDEVESKRATDLREAQQAAALQGPGASNNPNALAPSDNDPQGSDAGYGQPSAPGNVPLPEGSRPMDEDNLPRGGSEQRDAGSEQRESGGQDSGGQDSGSGDPEAIRRERLRASTASAAMAALQGDASGSGTDIEGEISKQTSRLNHWMLEAEIDGLIDSDISTCGLSLVVTLPTRIVFCTVLLLELKHALNGSKSMIPYFPTLTWESFMPPATEISIPLPNFFLYIAVLAYLLLVIMVTLVLVGVASLIVMEFGAQAGGIVYGAYKVKGFLGL